MSVKKPKILVVPFRYPTNTIKEQIELVDDSFEFGVLTGNRVPIGKKKFLKKKLTGKFSNRTVDHSTHTEFIYYDVNHIPARMKRNYEAKLIQELGRVVEEVCNGEKPDIIHIHSPNLCDLSVLVCDWAEGNNIPVLLTERILFYPRLCDTFSKRKYKVYERANRVLCVSNYLYRNLLTSGVDVPNCGIIGNLVNDTYVPEKFPHKKDTHRAIFAASHGHDKDIHILLDAVQILKKEGSPVTVDIFGLENDAIFQVQGEKVVLKHEIDKRGIEDRVNIRGNVPHSDLLKAYANYSFMISSSRSETFGIAVAEAILYGLPVVCTDSGGVREFTDEKNSILVPIRNPRKMASAIKELMNSYNQFDAKNNSDQIKEHFGIEPFKMKLLNEYQKLTKKVIN